MQWVNIVDDTRAIKAILKLNIIEDDSLKLTDEEIRLTCDAYRYLYDHRKTGVAGFDESAYTNAKAYYKSFQKRCSAHLDKLAVREALKRAKLADYYSNTLPKSVKSKQLKSTAEAFEKEIKKLRNEMIDAGATNLHEARDVLMVSLADYSIDIKNTIINNLIRK